MFSVVHSAHVDTADGGSKGAGANSTRRWCACRPHFSVPASRSSWSSLQLCARNACAQLTNDSGTGVDDKAFLVSALDSYQRHHSCAPWQVAPPTLFLNDTDQCVSLVSPGPLSCFLLPPKARSPTRARPPLQVLGIHDAQRQMGAIEQHAVVHQGCRRVNGQTHQPCAAI